MKIPPEVKIGGIIYNVEFKKFSPDPLIKEEAWGEIDYVACKIFIKDDLEKQMSDQIFIHEVLHGIEHEYNLKFTESEIQRVSHGIVAFLKDNNFLKD